MTDIDTMLAEVKRLDAEASAPLPFCEMCYGHRFVLFNGVAVPCNRCSKHDLTELHAYYRTAAPALAAAYEQQRGEVERMRVELDQTDRTNAEIGADRDMMHAECERLRAVLRSVQWSWVDRHGREFCAICSREKSTGHAKDCALAAALAPKGAER